MQLSKTAVRAIAIRRAEARRAAPVAANDDAAAPKAKAMSPALLAACVAAGGFDQNERYA